MAEGQLREWQRDALDYFETHPDNFLVVACPGAGKTTYALTAAQRLMDAGEIRRIVVVVPTTHLRGQWALAAQRSPFGIKLDEEFENGRTVLASDYDGVVVTYASVAQWPTLWHQLTTDPRYPTLVILDEVHHAGDAEHLSWGAALTPAFSDAHRRLLLSGTPFRTDGCRIPFVDYDERGRCKPGFEYDYGQAIRDGGVVRPIEFLALDGDVRWINAGGVRRETSLTEVDRGDLSPALVTALDPSGDWIPSVLRQADAELTCKRSDMSDAGGLVIASDQASARAYARHLRDITGAEPVLAISDDPDASGQITRFARGDQRWLVAVKMVSEGVDIPRLCVGVYATNTRTEMFVRQVVGRFVRQHGTDDETAAALFIPSVEPLLGYGRDIERSVDSALREDIQRRERDAERVGTEPLMFNLVEPVGSSEATHHATVYGGQEFPQDEINRVKALMEQADMPSNVTPGQAAGFLRLAGVGRVVGMAVVERPIVETSGPELTLTQQKKALRRLIQRLVGRLSGVTGEEYGHIHADLNTHCGGRIANARVEQLQQRIDLLNEWLTQA